MKKRFLYGIIIPILIVGAVPIIVLGIQNPGNVAQTSSQHTDPGLRTRRYAASLSEVRLAASQLIPMLSTYGRAWRPNSSPVGVGLTPSGVNGDPKTVHEDIEGQTLTIKAEVPVLVFTDDLQITLRTEKGATIVDVRSASRVGKGDFGENARHIRQLLSALDKKFKAAPATT